MSVLPFPARLTPTPASDAEIRLANQQEARTGKSRFRKTEATIEQIANAAAKQRLHPCSEEHLSTWLAHPDERVPIAMANHATLWRRVYHLICQTEQRRDLALAAYRRATASADAEGMAWTPLLDAITSRGHWPETDQPRTNQTEPAPSPEYRTPAMRCEELRPWVEAQTDPAEVDRLLAFEADAVWETVLRHTRVPTPALVERVKTAPRYESLSKLRRLTALAENPHLTPEVVEALWPLVADAAFYGTGKGYSPPTVPANGAAPAAEPLRARSALVALDRGYGPLHPNLKPYLLQGALEATGFRQEGWTPQRGALEALVAMAGTTEDDLLKLFANPMRFIPWCSEDIAVHPNATPAVWLAMARAYSQSEAHLSVLTRHPRARLEPAVRERLLRSSFPSVAGPLWPDATTEEFVASFRVAAKHSKVSVRWLRACPASHLDSLTPDDWAPVLTRVPAPGTLLALSCIPSARRDPAARQALCDLRLGGDVVTSSLAVVMDPEAAPLEERARVFASMVDHYPDVLLNNLEYEAEHMGPGLTMEMLAPFFTHPNLKVRQRILLVSSTLTRQNASNTLGRTDARAISRQR